MRSQPRSRRKGLSLLEVLAALVIFLLSLVALSQLIDTSTRQARNIQFQSEGTLLCQSKLAEFVAGVESVETGGEGDFEEDPNWRWSAESVAEGGAAGLYKVTVKVTRGQGGFEVSMSQFILAPSMRGNLSTSSTTTTTTDAASGSSSSSNSSSGGGAASGGGASTGGR